VTRASVASAVAVGVGLLAPSGQRERGTSTLDDRSPWGLAALRGLIGSSP
jgi:hypothetical protein